MDVESTDNKNDLPQWLHAYGTKDNNRDSCYQLDDELSDISSESEMENCNIYEVDRAVAKRKKVSI